MNVLRKILTVPVLALALITGAAADPALAADRGADGIGMVLAVEGAAEAVRGGSRLALKVRDRLREKDTVVTGAGAKLQILLDDDTSITMGAESSLEMREFSNAPENARFSAHIPRGRMRIITGETTERNPDGFRLTTRHATVGIRGTVLTLETNDDFTSVNVNNSDKTVIVNGTPVPEFYRAVIMPGGNVPQITPLPSGEREGDGELSTA
ncbi:MAG: FecR family protein, partial [Synergistaceae bacterium]|nr:FecR family protein [Synergistaceae bacterium]